MAKIKLCDISMDFWYLRWRLTTSNLKPNAPLGVKEQKTEATKNNEYTGPPNPGVPMKNLCPENAIQTIFIC